MKDLALRFLDYFKKYMHDDSIEYNGTTIKFGGNSAILTINEEDVLQFQYKTSSSSDITLDSRIIAPIPDDDKRVELFAELCASDVKRKVLGITDINEVSQSVLWGICRAVSDNLNICTISIQDSTCCSFDTCKIWLIKNKISVIREDDVKLGDIDVDCTKESMLKCSRYVSSCISASINCMGYNKDLKKTNPLKLRDKLINKFTDYEVTFINSHDTSYNVTFSNNGNTFEFVFDFIGANDLKISVANTGEAYVLSKDLIAWSKHIDNNAQPYYLSSPIVEAIIEYYLGTKSKFNVLCFANKFRDILSNIPYTDFKFDVSVDSRDGYMPMIGVLYVT